MFVIIEKRLENRKIKGEFCGKKNRLIENGRFFFYRYVFGIKNEI